MSDIDEMFYKTDDALARGEDLIVSGDDLIKLNMMLRKLNSYKNILEEIEKSMVIKELTDKLLSNFDDLDKLREEGKLSKIK